jgi:hypothetical protein
MFVWNISHSKNNWARYYLKGTYIFIESARYSSQILMELEFSKQNFEK